MGIFQNVEGVWTPLTVGPRVFDGLTKKWVDIQTVYTHAQGHWRQIWPEVEPVPPMIHIDPLDVVWPEAASVTVTIVGAYLPEESYLDYPEHPDIPWLGEVVVTSGEWTETFLASEGTATFQLPQRHPGTYPVSAVWSFDDVVHSSINVKVVKPAPVVMLEADPPVLMPGESAKFTITPQTYNEEPLSAGGFTELQWQQVPGGPYGPWSDRAPYDGQQRVITKMPMATVGYRARIISHPDYLDTHSDAVQVTIQTKTFGFDEVEAVFYRTYDADGNVKQDGQPVYHGFLSPQDGRQHGFVWLPRLPDDAKECLRVEVLWFPQYTHVDTSIPENDMGARIAFGFHTLDEHPESVEYGYDEYPSSVDYGDGNIQTGLYGARCNRGEMFSIDIPPLVPIVNEKRNGGFGIVVGHDSLDPDFFGYGYPTLIRYHWQKWV